MKGLKRIVLLGLCMAGCSHPGADGGDREMDRFVDSLLSEMTLEEKIGQLNLVPVDGSAMTGPVTESATGDRIAKGEIGALLNVMSPAKMLELQQAAVTESRLGIPLLFGMDVIHGYNTVFPIPLGLSATWNPESIERSARISAVEASAQGVNWTFSPMVDISFDPRWGRVAEGSGEDPYLASLIAAAYVRGYQGDLSRNDQILACVKHFALYGAPEGGRDYNSVDMSRQRMYTDYFPPYRSAVEAGAGSVMGGLQRRGGSACGRERMAAGRCAAAGLGFRWIRRFGLGCRAGDDRARYRGSARGFGPRPQGRVGYGYGQPGAMGHAESLARCRRSPDGGGRSGVPPDTPGEIQTGAFRRPL